MRLSVSSLFDLGELPPELRRSLGLVYASSVLVIMGVNLIQPVLPAMIAPFGITDAEVGLVIAVYTAPAIVLAPLLGVVADRYGRRPLLVGGLILFGVAGTAVAFAPNFGWVLALRAVQGIGFSAVIPLTIVLIGDLLEDRREVVRPGAQGLHRPGGRAGAAASGRRAGPGGMALAVPVLCGRHPPGAADAAVDAGDPGQRRRRR